MKKLFILFFLLSIVCYSQNTESSVYIKAYAKENKILLRWAVNTPIEWQKANKNGFNLYKILIKKDGKLIEGDPQKKKIAVLQAEKVEKWTDFIQKDRNAAIIAQALYGESFVVEQNNENEISKIVNISEEITQRHSFALFAADMSFEGAKKAGWGYVDTDVNPHETYIYQIEAINLPQIKSSSVMIGVSDHEKLPQIQDFTAINGDKKVLFSWGTSRYKDIFSSYMIEVSENEKDFQNISQTPIVDMNSSKNNQAFFSYNLENNDKIYYFRIYGINSFGEKSERSKVLKIQGISSIVATPRISDYVFLENNATEIYWEYPQEAENSIEKFELWYNLQDKSDYKKVIDNIKKEDRKQIYDKLSASNYFKIAAVDKDQKRLFSQSVLIQPIDSIPPKAPIELEGKIDSLGVVSLVWKNNIEPDLSGYRIFRKNTENEEFVDVFNDIISQNYVQDTLNFSISNKKVYYKILAEDYRYNRSDFSDVLILEKPDKIPPTAPVFKDFKVEDEKVTLFWTKSYSDDIQNYILSKREKGSEKWQVIKTFTNETTSFSDNSFEKEAVYEYLIQAKDKSGLYSLEDNSILRVKSPSKTKKILKNIEFVIDRNSRDISFFWNYEKALQVTELHIYKNEKGMKPSLWKVVDGKQLEIVDKNVSINSVYEYYFVPTLSDKKPVKGEKIEVVF